MSNEKMNKLPLILLITVLAFLAGGLGAVAVLSTQETKITAVNPQVVTPTPTPTPTLAEHVVAVPSNTPPKEVVSPALIPETPGPVWERFSDPYQAPTLEKYLTYMQESVSDYWLRTYTSPRVGNSSITDFNVHRLSGRFEQISVPSTLMAWSGNFAAPWNTRPFSIAFKKEKQGYGFFGEGDPEITVSLLNGNEGWISSEDVKWNTLSCAIGVADDIAVAANFFAEIYPQVAADVDACKHITKSILKDSGYPDAEVSAYTLDTPFKEGVPERGGAGLVYRPTITMRVAKKEEMQSNLQNGYYGLMELDLHYYDPKEIPTLKASADGIIRLLPETKLTPNCIYDYCY
ncbi:MAG: hypothetical protein WC813_01715 [Patescibacteria group bacterium]|jgi:hypothetical protein